MITTFTTEVSGEPGPGHEQAAQRENVSRRTIYRRLEDLKAMEPDPPELETRRPEEAENTMVGVLDDLEPGSVQASDHSRAR